MPIVLAALPEIILALTLLLILYAARSLFGGVLSSMASRIPLLGRVLATAIDAIISDAVNIAAAAAVVLIDKLEGIILAPVYWVEHILADIWDSIDALRQVVAYVVGSVIPLAISTALTEAVVLIDRAVSIVDLTITTDVLALQSEITQAYTAMAALAANLEGYALALVASAEAYTTAAVTAETAYIETGLASLETQIQAVAAAEAAYVETAVGDAIAYTQAAVIGLEGTIAADTSAITAWVLGQVTSLTAAIDAVQTTSLAFALGAVAAVEADLGKLKAECTDNLCSGAGELASLLNGLVEQGFIAALLGYAAWGISDPVGCGNDTAKILTPIATGAKDTVDAVIHAL